MVGRGELTDKAWAVIEPLLPDLGAARGRWGDHRQVINGILWKLRTGAPWRDLPERYGPWKTCHERLRRWAADGTWDKILAAAQVRDDGRPSSGSSAWTPPWSGRNSTPLMPGKKRGALVPAEPGEAVGRSRDGLSTKIHLAADGRGRPLAVVLSPGQVEDNPFLRPVLDAIRVPGPHEGRPRKQPSLVLADKGYAHDSTRVFLRRRGIRHSVATSRPAVPPG